MVGSELEFETVRGLTLGRLHDPGIIDDRVKPVGVVADCIIGRSDRVDAGQVELHEFQGTRPFNAGQIGNGLGTLLGGPRRDDDVGVGPTQMLCRLVSDSGVRTGDEVRPASQIVKLFDLPIGDGMY
jgi:hypothetical protein